MAKYALTNTNAGSVQALTTTYKTGIALTAATGATTLRKAWINYFALGTQGTPTDNVVVLKIDRQSSTGTGTTATPAPLDPTDAAALITAMVNHTAEPTTIAGVMFEEPVNTRATFQWVAIPGNELIVPSTNTTGIGLRYKSPSLTTTDALLTINFIE